MGKQHSAINKKSNNPDNPHRKAEKGNMRSKSTIMRLNMYKRGKPVRDKDGKQIGGSLMMSTQAGGKDVGNVARIAPNRRWFGNTRIISQQELDSFRMEMTSKESDPYSVILRRNKIPMTLLQESTKEAKVKILQTETFESVFGNKKTRKRPTMINAVNDYETLLNYATSKGQAYDKEPEKDSNVEADASHMNGTEMRKDDLFSKGQSKRIWGELYKVLDCSDVILQIVDARNVPGTRCEHVENHVKKNASHKQLVIVLNKCDLVPNWVTRKWIKILSAKFPTLAFHASLTNAFGKGALISLLRQFGKLHSDKRQISVGVIGYPNTGKSSVINALMGRTCCKAAPIPGETKVWQYITLTKKIFLIDCPGIVYDVGDSEVETVLKGVVRAERLQNPQDFVGPILSRVKKEHIQKHYGISEWSSDADFLSKLALHKGKLLKGGEPDCDGVAKTMIYDWQRGKLPFFVAPPKVLIEGVETGAAAMEDINDNDEHADEDDDDEVASDDVGQNFVDEEEVDSIYDSDDDDIVEDNGDEVESDDDEEEKDDEEEEDNRANQLKAGLETTVVKDKRQQVTTAVAATAEFPAPKKTRMNPSIISLEELQWDSLM